MKKRLPDILFILVTGLSIFLFYFIYNIRGLAVLTLIFLLPIYIMRILFWGFWPKLRSWLTTEHTPGVWNVLVFSIWIILALLLLIVFAPQMLSKVGRISLPLWIQIAGFVLAVVGLVLSLWAQSILGLETAIHSTRIFENGQKGERRVINTGPYALLPHPIFLGEWLIILGCFLFTSEILLLGLLLIAVIVDRFSAKSEEKDLRQRFGKEYQDYRSHFH